MSLESLGSLARTVSDRFLRDNLRRIISGTNVSMSSVLDGKILSSPHQVLYQKPVL